MTAEHRRWLVATALVVYGISLCVRRSGDFDGYLEVGGLILSGGHPYWDPPPGLNTWPPFFSVFCVPLAVLAKATPYLARAAWVALNFAALWVVLDLLARLVLGAPLRRRDGGPGVSILDPALLVPLLLTSRYVLNNYSHLQVNLLVFAIALWGLWRQAEGRTLSGGAAIGLAASLKVMPVLFVPYLAYRGRWRAALAAGAATAAFSLSPVLVVGWERFVDYVLAWRTMVGRGWGVGKMNQSVFAMLDRFLGHGMEPLGETGRNGIPASGEPIVMVAVVALAVVVALLGIRTFRGRIAPAGFAAQTEWSVVFVCSAIFAPVTWKAYLVVLLLPNTLLFALCRARRLDRATRIGAGLALGVAFALGWLTTRGFVGKWAAGSLEMSSVVTLAALTVLSGLFWVRSRLDPDTGPPGSPENCVRNPENG
jgi:hypothetical protein